MNGRLVLAIGIGLGVVGVVGLVILDRWMAKPPEASWHQPCVDMGVWTNDWKPWSP